MPSIKRQVTMCKNSTGVSLHPYGFSMSGELANLLGVTEDSIYTARISEGAFIMVKQTKTGPVYTLKELLDQCDINAPQNEEAIEWMNASFGPTNAKDVGGEA